MQAVPPSGHPGIPRSGDLVGGRYVVQRIAQRGPLSMTLLAHDSAARSMALVVLYPGSATGDTVARFVQEARIAAQIDSDHVARVYEVGQLPEGAPFVAMEYVDGSNLAEVMAARGPLPLPIAAAVDLLLQAVEGVACAHARGVLHTDLRPSCMLLVPRSDGAGVLKVLDFELTPAHPGGAPPSLFPLRRRTQGSSAYLSPERASDVGIVDVRADVWSLGAVLFQLVTGAPPFGDGTSEETLEAILGASRDALRARLRDVPGPLADAILRCLEHDREKRFGDVAELGEALAPYGTGAQTPYVRRAREALSRPPSSFYSTMPLHVIPATPPPPPAPAPPVAQPSMERTLAFTPTPYAMPVQQLPSAAFTPAPVAVAPAPEAYYPPLQAIEPARASGPSGLTVAFVGGLLAVAIAGAAIWAFVLRPRDAALDEPLPAETTSAAAVTPPAPEPPPSVTAAATASAAPEPTETASAAPSAAVPEPSAAAEPPAPSIAPSVVPSSAPTAPPVASAVAPPRPPVALPAPKRPSRTDLLRSRE